MQVCEITHDAERHRFATTVEGYGCELDYKLSGKVMTITHTGVPAPIGNRGIAAQMTRFALETARTNGWQVVPACSYAAAFMQRHPEFDDLRRR